MINRNDKFKKFSNINFIMVATHLSQNQNESKTLEEVEENKELMKKQAHISSIYLA